MSEIYVIVADSAQARIFHTTGRSNPLVEIETLEHAEGRLHARDLTSDLSGHGSNHTGSGKHKMDAATDPREYEQEKFSRSIANYLSTCAKENNIDRIMLAAPPVLLGMLREHIDPGIINLISIELDKNLTQFTAAELRSYFEYFKPVERVTA